MNDTKRIVWMLDETIANTRPSEWGRVRELEESLIRKIGNPEFEHEIVDPIPCLKDIARQLEGQEFSSIIDLTGWLTPAFQELFPQTPIESRFSLSRVRVVSSPQLETTGYTVNMSPQEVEEAKQLLNLSKPLIVDDASFSGLTSRKTMQLWGINPESATHAFLIANTGNLGPNPGAVPMLESTGGRVIFSHELKTPEDDGWHLKDLHQNPNLERSFNLALLFHESAKRDGLDSQFAKTYFSDETVLRTLFPESVTSSKIKSLIGEGKFILRNGNVIDGKEIHARNPFLWASPYFQEHVDFNQIIEGKDEIISLLGELRALTTDPEGKIEASRELQREIQRMKNPQNVEGQFAGRKERL